MLGDRIPNDSSEHHVVLIKLLLLLDCQQLLRGREDIFMTQVSDLANAVVIKGLISWLDALEHVLLFTVSLDVLLANEF